MTPFAFVSTGKDAQRAFLCGQTRSGKTTLAISLANEAQRAVWLDVKRENDPRWPVVPATEFLYAGGSHARMETLSARLAETPRIVVQMADLPAVSDEDQLEAVAEAAFHLGNVLFILDDAMGVMESRPSYYLNRILTMGASRGCGFMAIAQRVHRIPLVFITEAQHVISFVVYGGADEERLVREVDPAFAGVRDLPQRHFIWCDRPAKTVQVFTPLRGVG